MPLFNSLSFQNFALPLIILALLATLLSACGETTSTTAPATATTQAAATTSSSAAATTAPPSQTSSITQTTTAPGTTSAATPPPITSTVATSTTVTTINGTTAATTAPATTAPSDQSTPGQTKLTTAPAVITRASGEKINMIVELARTGEEQETGLMGRTSVPDETGMLFIFPNTSRVAFWMKDTPLALSIAFITQDGKIIDIQDMDPYSLTTHQPNQDYLYALEVAKGYFAKRGIAPGDTFTFQS